MTEVSAPASTSWSREKIEELLRSEPFNYQAIPLPYGLSTGGHDRSSTAKAILPDDMTGQSFLDVGCALGYFCFEARRRGAGRVVGFDLEIDNVRKGRLLADILGQPVEFQLGDIEHGPIGESFDHVICLNVLHHLADPIQGLDRLIAATRRRLILELATFGAHDRRKLGMTLLQQRTLARLPALLVGRGTAGEGVKQFYITKSAIENLLRYRRGCFASVEIVPSTFKERFLVIATKRQIDKLMIVGSPMSSAMAPLVQKVIAGQQAEAARFLGLEGKASVLRAENYHEPQTPHQPALAFDYDFMRPFTSGAGTFEHDPALDVIDTADKARAVTVWLPREQLIKAAEADIGKNDGKRRKQLVNLLGQYENPKHLAKHYRAWFQYLARKNVDHRILWMKPEGPMLLTLEEWERDVAAAIA